MLAFVPLFVRLLGTEAYGLIVLSSTGISILGNIDLGLSITLNREVAAGGMADIPQRNLAALAGTLELLYWTAALLFSLAGVLLAPYLTGHWLNVASLPAASVVGALRLMAPAVALQLPITIYSAALLGRGRQASLSIIASAASSARTIGAAALLLYYKADIEIYFALQLAVTLVQVLVMRGGYRRQFPAAVSMLKVGWAELGRLWRFSAGVAVISATAVLISQLDKVLISWLLPLRDVGYYGIAWALTGGLRILSAPVFNALFPRLTKAVASRDSGEAEKVYHSATQLLSVLIWPPAWLMLLCSEPLLYLWTHNAGLAGASAPALSFLAVGGALNGLMLLPFALQLANGWTRLTMWLYVGSLAFLVPALYLGATWYGLTGVAAVWPAINLGYLVIGVALMHRRLLPGRMWLWYLRDCAAPCLASLLVVAVLLHWRPDRVSLGSQLPWLALAYLAQTAAAVLAAPAVRSALHKTVLRLRGRLA